MTEQEKGRLPTCGLVMPITLIDGCGADHWADVRKILDAAIVSAGFSPHLVSDANESGVIQKRIIQNLYSDPIVVCDVSGKNPNVMFELGLRLAFDKPTIIVKDDVTDYVFDTAVIEHVGYPRTLRYAEVLSFRKELGEKLTNTHKAASNGHGYSTFLQNFGSYHVARIEETEVSQAEIIIEQMAEIRNEILDLGRSPNRIVRLPPELRDTYTDNGIARQLIRKWLQKRAAETSLDLENVTEPLFKQLRRELEDVHKIRAACRTSENLTSLLANELFFDNTRV